MNYYEKNKSEKGYTIHPLWKWVLFAAVVIFCIITILTQQTKIDESKKLAEELAATADQLEERIDTLENELAYMDTDEYVERTARERLGMIKPDETIFKAREDEAPGSE